MERVVAGPGQIVARSVDGGLAAKVENASAQDAFVTVEGRNGWGFRLSGSNPPAGAVPERAR
jgi:hypothetical protein